jgi:hypothetical protein
VESIWSRILEILFLRLLFKHVSALNLG